MGRAALEAARLLLAGEKWSGVAATGEGRGARGDRLLRKLIAGAGAGAYGLGDSLFSAEGERCEHWHVFTRPLAGNGSVALIEKQYLVIMNRGSFSDCGGP